MTRIVRFTTPGRLHFGLTRLGGTGRQFGGLGLMLDGSGVSLAITSAPKFQTEGLLQPRVKAFADAFVAHLQLTNLPACSIEVTSASPEHVGLGVGTQLGLAVVAGLAQWLDIPWRDAQLLAAMSGRGSRSAIGTHGFLLGGLLVDDGKLPHEHLGRLANRIEIPPEWRFVLIRPPGVCGLAGSQESQAIGKLPAIPEAVTTELQRMTHQEILPAVRAADCPRFSGAIFRYGYLAGKCFAPAQGGAFATPEIAQLVAYLQDLGISGVGQSSWGPTVFAVTANPLSAQQLVDRLQADRTHQHYHFTITRPNNRGVYVQQMGERKP